ncbi:MAG: hypothetical protein EA376_11205 [Phycisphaeraceae bacterium]|nr:MAG: hypothetical protein EA376_11205 [Phycisphaeraceae bacterium]
MRTGNENVAGQARSEMTTNHEKSTSHDPVMVVVNGETLKLSLNSGLTHTQDAAVTQSVTPMMQQND